ncbi:hypothetical protein Ga0061063_2096 [Gulbenkiania indica]|uniref:HDOD domain-containing protein n=1 Tax=Gulbenkiania indica TaxID=375574 RepID=A0A0K6H0R5_9NEIS|nr:hypothetical protein [Gulbenkiania indica]CUA84475.1 hypothetical protein Ga0061063_2096 [Gulbenkiania indica]
MELANWLQSIAERRWPILPDTLSDLRQACARHSDLIRFTDMANLCLSDPLLLFDLMRMVGGSRSLQQHDVLPSVEKILMLIGLEGTLGRFGRLTPLESVPGRLSPEVIEAVGDWLARGRVAAILAKTWLSQAGELKVEDCYMAALLYNLPACFYLIYRNDIPDKPLLQAVSETFGVAYPQLLEAFVRTMPLPVGLLALLGKQGGASRRKQILRLAVATANGLEQGWWRATWTVGIEAAARLTGLTFEEAYGGVVNAVRQVALHPRAPGYAHPAKALLLLEGEYHRPRQHAVSTLTDAEQLDLSIREAMRHLANDLHFERVLFFQYVRDNHHLRLRYQLGVAEDQPLRRARIELEPGSFFALLTSKPQSFHAPAAVRAQLRQKYGDPFFTLSGESDFALLTLFSGQTLAGVFYVDHGNSGRAIDEDSYHGFKSLITRLTHRF